MSENNNDVTITVDASRATGPLKRIWRSIGYDEINWTYTPKGTQVLQSIAVLDDGPFYIRNHNAFTSGNGLSRPFSGSTNLYTEAADGTPVYDWSIIDRVYDHFLAHNCKPMVELDFMPSALSSVSGPDAWRNPPRDYGRWRDLNTAFAGHLVERYGLEEVRTWYFSLWNECDCLHYFQGNGLRTIGEQQLFKLFDFAIDGIKRVDAGLRVGGPDYAWYDDFLERFLRHCESGWNESTGSHGTPLDFISLHYKATGHRRATNSVPSPDHDGYARRRLLGLKSVLDEFPCFRHLPILGNEWDIDVGTDRSAYEHPGFAYRNTSYFPVFLIRGVKGLLDTCDTHALNLELITQWTFYFEGLRCFEGDRSLFDATGVRRPVFNAFEMLARLGDERLAAGTDDTAEDIAPGEKAGWFGHCRPDDSTDAVSGDELDRIQPHPCVDVLAARDSATGAIQVLVWNQAVSPSASGCRQVKVVVKGLAGEAKLTVKHLRIDEHHSNAHTVWKRLGSPDWPTPDQIRQMREREKLEPCREALALTVTDGTAELHLSMPMHAVSLLLLKEA